MIEINNNVALTPKLLAEGFWNLGDDQQADFFSELYELTKDHYGDSEMQWCRMSDRLEENPKAKDMACRMMVWIFNRATDFLSKQP